MPCPGHGIPQTGPGNCSGSVICGLKLSLLAMSSSALLRVPWSLTTNFALCPPLLGVACGSRSFCSVFRPFLAGPSRAACGPECSCGPLSWFSGSGCGSAEQITSKQIPYSRTTATPGPSRHGTSRPHSCSQLLTGFLPRQCPTPAL